MNLKALFKSKPRVTAVTLPDSINELLSDNEISGMIQNFIDEDMADVCSLVMIYQKKDGTVLSFTNLDQLTVFGLVWMALDSRGANRGDW